MYVCKSIKLIIISLQFVFIGSTFHKHVGSQAATEHPHKK